ncbi:hypothetical protein DSL72_004526 [Monilinia vaccinii-corymbosi]|uniref:USP domain-containing protein n=1 Tax=Monilinia vaccinii-corymbosi TaxID=61207 RepID=A0A8A3P7J7_9HELO|nr:hypothetical protein DSL72_004526 [Monilinia vaccinii-corymbosi]
MDQDQAEPSPERPVSSEPCSTHPVPFDDSDQHSARKRQKTSRSDSGSRSRSVDTTKASEIPLDPMSSEVNETDVLHDSILPSTPTRPTTAHSQVEPTSSRVTINLRTPQPPSNSALSNSNSPITPSKMTNAVEDGGARISIESESDILSTVPASVIGTPSSSSAMEGSPEVELVHISSDDPERSPSMAIIDEEEVFPDPLYNFPTQNRGENVIHALKRVAHILQYDPIETEDVFIELRDWIDKFLRFCHTDSRLHGAFTRHRDFWFAFPDMIWALNYRTRYFGQFMQRTNRRSKSLTQFLYQYARLSGRFLAMDVKTLSFDTDQLPELASPRFLPTFSHLQKFDADLNHIGKNLQTYYNWRWEEDTSEFQTYFEGGGASIFILTKYVEGQLKFVSSYPRIFDNLTEPSRLVEKFNTSAVLARRHPLHTEDAIRKLASGYEYFNIMNFGLESIIEKNVTFLTPDAATTHLNSLALILFHSLWLNPQVGKDRIELQRKTCPGIEDSQQLAKIISLEWKFSVLKKLITSAQMQLRVVGVTTMCQDLLALHSAHRSKEALPNGGVILLHFAKLILQHKLIDYIVGIGSHPEIINESSNIVGFLVVTKTYEDEQTDTIWQTVMTSQDPRVVEAILRMVKKVLNLYEYSSCLYICQKVSTLPIQAFTFAMRDFCENLFREIATKSGRRELDAPPYDICVRLIRESSITSDGCPNGYPDIQNFAANHLRELLVNGPCQEARRDIYLDCIKDISNKTSTAPGSICVINALLNQSLMPDLETLATKHGLTRLMVDELELNISGNRSLAYDSPANLARREILQQIISTEPDTINSELGKRLWNLLVGSRSNDTADRLAGWDILNDAFQEQGFGNRYLSICFQNYLPKLEPIYFLEGTLRFVRSGLYSLLDEKKRELADNKNVKLDLSFDFLAMEQLWRIIESAPQVLVYEKAIEDLVDVYVGSFIQELPRIRARELHLSFITRCFDKLADAASKLKASGNDGIVGDDEDMVMMISDSQIQEQELLFTRSLATLQAFLAAYSSSVHFITPKLRSITTTSSNDVRGPTLKIMYQAFDENTSSIRELTIGAQDTAATLVARLQNETEFTSCRVFYCGKEFKHDEAELCKSVEDLNLTGLVLVKRRDDTDPPLPTSNDPLQMEITKKFDQIWSYLGMQENLAEKIYSFLIQFPVYDRIMEDLGNSAVPYTEIFPLGQPFKALYSLYGLKQYISSQTSKGSVDGSVFDRAMTLLIAAISDSEFIESSTPQAIRQTLAMHFVSSLASLLKDPSLPSSSTVGIDDKLLRRLLDLLNAAKLVTTTETSVHLIWTSVEALLEVATQNSTLWATFIGHLNGSNLLQDLLLDDPRPFVRKSILKHVTSKFTFNPNSARVSTSEVAITLWPIIVKLIPVGVERPEQCEEMFLLALTIFKRLLETPTDLNLNTFIKEWGNLLLNHKNYEDVGLPETVDMITQGLINLLHHAAITMKQTNRPLSCGNLAVELFNRHLFPTLSNEENTGSDGLIAQKIPLINSRTRNTMGETIFALVKDDMPQYKEIFLLLSNLTPYNYELDNPYSFEMWQTFERSKYIRSSTGYVGLKNLSNTCYLNSLTTQLFMNVSFREFIFDSHIADPGSQKLLLETQRLFSFMQNSMRRFVDPTNFAASIPTFEEQEIDVNVQMDVDEFYNLLFDRFERENLTDDDKRKVRSFYGGKLVQQIKSKECPHISGRLEDFSAIQCDIKGKKSLEESLQAYVEGEAMEGDNKYKCETCNRHVDAVKRACLKDVPDNLIFHLKRFDFNLRTLTRNKINDYFTFPSSIDMRPYKVEYLMNESGEIEEDIFELVGVLVHSGTAESGHYYSFIRERPQVDGKGGWVEFNDDLVTSWDPTFMEAACYGGVEHPTFDNPIQFDKNYSAYMLFYQRSTTLTIAKEEVVKNKNANPWKAAIDIGMENNPLKATINKRQANHITLENEQVLRKYCLYDPAHVLFARNIFENLSHLNNGKCSVSHELEKQAIWVAMCHLDQIVARSKDAPDIGTFVTALRMQFQQCGECSQDFLDYVCKCTESFRFLLMRCPEAMVRSEVSAAILEALVSVKNGVQYAYGFGGDGNIIPEDSHLLEDVVSSLIRLYENFHNSLRAWPDYFGLLTNIANLGDHETAVLLDSGFLSKTLDIICADAVDANNSQLQRMLQLIAKRSTSARPVSYDSVIDLLSRLISACDPEAPEPDPSESRLQLSLDGNKLPFTWEERRRMNLHWTRTHANILTEKLLAINQNQQATKSIISTLLHFQNDINHLDRYIYVAITHGIRRNNPLPWGPFLRAAILYCEHSENPQAIHDMATHVAKASSNIDNNDGSEYLRFFKDLVNLQSNSCGISRKEIMKIALFTVSHWAPAILTHYESSVRSDTEDFLGDFIFNYGAEVDDTAPANEIDLALYRIKMAQRLGHVCLDYLDEIYVVQRVQAVRPAMVNIEHVGSLCLQYFEAGKAADEYKMRMDSKFISASLTIE